jgi:hypothetical protein
MTAGTISAVLRPLALLALIAAVAGCGSSTQTTPKLADLPLVGGTRVIAQSIKCDKGVNAFCGLELVVVGPHFRDSNDLLLSEHLHLKSLGWTGANADIGGERAADSPGHKLHLTFGTADTDLRGTALGWIKRARTIQLTLSQQIFARVPSLSMLLEEGPG